MKGSPGLNILFLILGATGFYTYVGQLVPQKEVLPPAEVKIAQDLSAAELVPVGAELAEGKGLCLTCHTIGQSGSLRFPDLAGIGGRASERAKEATAATGVELDAVGYLAQSLYEPNVFVVPGFNPGMPEIHRPPIGLSDEEVLAVIAWLQSLGSEPTVTLATEHPFRTGAGGGASG